MWWPVYLEDFGKFEKRFLFHNYLFLLSSIFLLLTFFKNVDKNIKKINYSPMEKQALSLSTPCPSCQSALSLKALGCTQCGCEIRGVISMSPLARLDDEMTHFLMVFIHCGGKISDVEKALGISYPTVKTKLAKLQGLLSSDSSDKTGELSASQDAVMSVLSAFESQEIGYEEMMKKIKKLKETK